MLATLLIGLREGLEAALIIGIILAYLAVVDRKDLFKSVWLGVISAFGLSILGGVAVYSVLGEMKGTGQAIFEGVATGSAVIVLTYMVFWMKKQARNLKGELHAQIEKALTETSWMALPVLAFIAVIREGIETVLMTFAAVNAGANSGTTATESLIGLFVGLGISIFLGYLVYQGGVRLNLRIFFNVTGAFLVVIAAGLAGYATKEFVSAGFIPYVGGLYDLRSVLPNNDQSILGSVLKGMIGYNPRPSLIESLAYFSYLITVMTLLFKHPKPKKAPVQVEEAAAGKA